MLSRKPSSRYLETMAFQGLEMAGGLFCYGIRLRQDVELMSTWSLVVNGWWAKALLLDSIGREVVAIRVAQHEAGYCLIVYLLGLLPKSYSISTQVWYLPFGTTGVIQFLDRFLKRLHGVPTVRSLILPLYGLCTSSVRFFVTSDSRRAL